MKSKLIPNLFSFSWEEIGTDLLWQIPLLVQDYISLVIVKYYLVLFFVLRTDYHSGFNTSDQKIITTGGDCDGFDQVADKRAIGIFVFHLKELTYSLPDTGSPHGLS